MGHPSGGKGNPVSVTHTFAQAYAYVAGVSRAFTSTTGEPMTANQGLARDGVSPLIVLRGRKNVHGRVCSVCWGYSKSCSGSRVSQAIVPFDASIVP